jgi:hypothetical protein
MIGRQFPLTVVTLVLLAANPAHADVSISNKPTHNMDCQAGVCTATAKKAVLNVGDLQTMLASGDVTVKTGNVALDIEINEQFSWTNTSRLTLDANTSVSFKAPVTVAGQGAITILTNDGGTGGDLLFFPPGQFPGGTLDFWDTSSSLVINGTSYVLVRDIATLASDVAANPSGFYAMAKHYKAGSYSQSPIATTFLGALEGLGHSVNKLHVSVDGGAKGQPCTGFLAAIGSGGTVRDIRITHAAVTSSLGSRMIGVLAGCNAGNVVNAWSDGAVQSARRSEIGGLVGHNEGTISNSGSAATTTGDDSLGGSASESVGGLVGFNSGDIAGSQASGSVSASRCSRVGGLVGWGYSGSIAASHATGAVQNGDICFDADMYAGGLVGLGGNIAASYATGAVSGGAGWDNGDIHYAFAGGLVGGGSNVTNSYSTGAVKGGDHLNRVGGLAGLGNAISAAYATGTVAGGDKTGGFVGYDNEAGDLSDTYWDLDTSGIADPSQGAGNIPNDPGITGLTDAQLKSALPDGFDPNIWSQSPNINNGYPYLLANPPQ